MDINATLLVEMVIFLLFFLLTKQYIWPPIIQVLDDRRATIEKGLRQADEAKAELAKAEKKAEETIHKAASTAKEGGWYANCLSDSTQLLKTALASFLPQSNKRSQSLGVICLTYMPSLLQRHSLLGGKLGK